MYSRAFSSLGCPTLDLAGVLALAGRHDISGVELRALGGGVDLPAYFADEFSRPESLPGPGPAATVRVLALDTSFSLVDATPASREQLLNYVPWARALEVPWLRVFDGGKTGDQAEIDRAARTLEWWRELRARNHWDIDVLVETHDSLLTADAVGRLLAAAPGTAILWDAHHTWRRGGEDPVVTWRAIGTHVRHIHVKDSIGQPGAVHPFTYVLPGMGEFPMERLRAVLAAEFAGFVSLEWERHWHPDLPALEEALATAARKNWW